MFHFHVYGKDNKCLFCGKQKHMHLFKRIKVIEYVFLPEEGPYKVVEVWCCSCGKQKKIRII